MACRSGTTSGPNSARNGAVHRSSAQAQLIRGHIVHAQSSPAGTAATGATPHDRHARAMMKQGLGAALVPPALRTATGIQSWRAATVQAT